MAGIILDSGTTAANKTKSRLPCIYILMGEVNDVYYFSGSNSS